MTPIIAIVGCDGSGKSTVSAEVVRSLNNHSPTIAVHLGKQAGNIARSITTLPLVGGWFNSVIQNKAKSYNSAQQKSKTPGILPALVMYVFTIRRLLRFKRMLKLRRQGNIIVADRFPQLEVPHAYDGPSLYVAERGSPLVNWLARREHRLFEWMCQYQPNLVIRLNVDLDTACARKPDHERQLLEKKIAVTPLLTFAGAHMVDIDSCQPIEKVVAEAVQAAMEVLEKAQSAAQLTRD